jgi:Ferritin-like domain
VSASITRGQLLSRGAKGGTALLVAGAGLGRFVDTAAADPLPTADLAYARLLVAVELLASDFYTQAIAAANTGKAVTGYLNRAYANEQEHYQSVAGIISGAGQTPAVSGDIDFSYPAGTFDSQKSIVAFARQLEGTMLGTYLGAIGGIQTDSLKAGLARIAACEAQHSAYFATALGGKAFSLSFPPALTIDQASDAIDAFTA